MTFWQALVQFLADIFKKPNLPPALTNPPPPSSTANPPVVAPIPTQPPAPTAPSQLAQAILSYNNGLWEFKTSDTFTNDAKGVVVHKINTYDAARIATRIKQSADKYNLPVTFVLGCLAIESTLDPLCQNGNFEGSNPTKAPDGYDVGIAQLKLKYLLSQRLPSTDAARAYALDIDKAIPYHCGLMEGKVEAAKDIIAANTSSAPDARLNNPLMLATCMYNFGNTGGKDIYEKGEFPSHCQQVLDLERHFAAALGVPSCFADITG